MTTELQGRLMAIMNELSSAKLPAIIIVRSTDQITAVKNSHDRVTSELFMEYMNGSEDRMNAFLDVLEEKLANIPNESTEQPATEGTTAE
ncbi:hypothetical protein [Chryseobacterium sp. 2R14A]|uniref:hypothetical protein n=1 Tax=Chryseobacterium sp. 2R14A TaxID=3380353 RepID=UPI003CEE7CCD